MKFKIVYDGNETNYYLIDDVLVSTSDHCRNGWAGMEGMSDLFEEIARITGNEFEFDENPDFKVNPQ